MADPDPLAFGIELQGIRDRLALMNYFVTIADVLDASEALDGTIEGRPPAAFVATSQERAEPNKLVGGFSQRVRVNLNVLFCENASRMDRATRDQMERTRRAVMRQLVGFKPINAEDALEYSTYGLVTIGGGIAWGEVSFRASYRFTLD